MKMRIYYDQLSNGIEKADSNTGINADEKLGEAKQKLDQHITTLQAQSARLNETIQNEKFSNASTNSIKEKVDALDAAIKKLQELRAVLDTGKFNEYNGGRDVFTAIQNLFNLPGNGDRERNLAKELNSLVTKINTAIDTSQTSYKKLSSNILSTVNRENGTQFQNLSEFTPENLRTQLKERLEAIKQFSVDSHDNLLAYTQENGISTRNFVDIDDALNRIDKLTDFEVRDLHKKVADLEMRMLKNSVFQEYKNTPTTPRPQGGPETQIPTATTPTLENRTDTAPITPDQQKVNETLATQSQAELEKNYANLSANLDKAISSGKFDQFKEAFSAIAKETKSLRETRDNTNLEPTRKAIKKYVDLLISKKDLSKITNAPKEAATYVDHEIAFAILQQDAQYAEGTNNRAALAETYLPKVEMSADQIMTQVYHMENGYYDYFRAIGTIIGMQRDNKPAAEIIPLIKKVQSDMYFPATEYRRAGWKTELTVKDKDNKPAKAQFDMNQHGIKEKYEELIANFEANFPDYIIKSPTDTGKTGKPGENPNGQTGKNAEALKALETLSTDDKKNFDIYTKEFKSLMEKTKALPMPTVKEDWNKNEKDPAKRSVMIKKVLEKIKSPDEDNATGSIIKRNEKGEIMKDNDLGQKNIPGLDSEVNAVNIEPIVDKDGLIRGLKDVKNKIVYNFTRVPGSKYIEMRSDKKSDGTVDTTTKKPWVFSKELVEKWKKDPKEYTTLLSAAGIPKSFANIAYMNNGDNHENIHIKTIVLPEGTKTNDEQKTNEKVDTPPNTNKGGEVVKTAVTTGYDALKGVANKIKNAITGGGK